MKYLILIVMTLSFTSCTCRFKSDIETGFYTNFGITDKKTQDVLLP